MAFAVYLVPTLVSVLWIGSFWGVEICVLWIHFTLYVYSNSKTLGLGFQDLVPALVDESLFSLVWISCSLLAWDVASIAI